MTRSRTRTGKRDPGRYHHGGLRAALVTEARQIVERDGPDQVSLRAVARAAGVSPAAPYHHFTDKTALLSAVAAHGFRDFTKLMQARAGKAATPRERLACLGAGYVEFGLRHPQLFRLMQGPSFQQPDADADLSAARQESFDLLYGAVSACLPGASQKRIRTACAAAWSIVHGMAILGNDGRLEALVDMSDIGRTAGLITAQLDVTKALEPHSGKEDS